MLLQRLEQVGSSRTIVLGGVPFQIDLGSLDVYVGAVIVVPSVAVDVSVLKNLPRWFLELGDQLVLVPLVICFDFFVNLRNEEVPRVA